MSMPLGEKHLATKRPWRSRPTAAERKSMAGYGSLADVMSVLEAALSRPAYLVGDRFTAADLYVGSHIGWGISFGTIEKRPAFERYVERISTRPAALRARAIDDALVSDNQQPAPNGALRSAAMSGSGRA